MRLSEDSTFTGVFFEPFAPTTTFTISAAGGDKTIFAPTISGLALHLDMSTEALRNYQDKGEFLATIKKAKQKVEVSLEQRLATNTVAGTIFNLKNNFGWKDKQEQEISGPGGGAQEHKWVIEVHDAKSNDT